MSSTTRLSFALVVASLTFMAACGDSSATRPASVEQDGPGGGSAGPTTFTVTDRAGSSGPRVLVVVAHPDDETTFAATLYKLTTHLDATCDLLTITNGEGGFKYSTLAESLYGLELTEEAIGRAELPAIRERELLEGLQLLGVHELTMLREQDHRYTRDVNEVLAPDAGVWDLARVRRELDARLAAGYDAVFTMFPSEQTHGHHQAATLLALEAVSRLEEDARPAVLAARVRDVEEQPMATLPLLTGYPETRTVAGPFSFDRTQTFGYGSRLHYGIVVDWVIAAHKSQGTMQLAAGRQACEDFYLFALSGPGSESLVAGWFERLAEPQFAEKTYGPSAGAPR